MSQIPERVLKQKHQDMKDAIRKCWKDRIMTLDERKKLALLANKLGLLVKDVHEIEGEVLEEVKLELGFDIIKSYETEDVYSSLEEEVDRKSEELIHRHNIYAKEGYDEREIMKNIVKSLYDKGFETIVDYIAFEKLIKEKDISTHEAYINKWATILEMSQGDD